MPAPHDSFLWAGCSFCRELCPENVGNGVLCVSGAGYRHWRQYQFYFFLRTELCLLSPASTPAVSRNFTHTLTLLTLLLHPYWEPDTSDPRHFGTETLRTQCRSVQKTLRHWVPKCPKDTSALGPKCWDTSDPRHFGTKTLRTFGLDTSDLGWGHFGTSAEMSRKFDLQHNTSETAPVTR